MSGGCTVMEGAYSSKIVFTFPEGIVKSGSTSEVLAIVKDISL